MAEHDAAHPGRRALLPILVWFGSWVLARALLESSASPPLRIGAALLPVVPFIWFLMAFIGMVRAGDELERRVHLEALAVAFPLALLLLMVLGLLELAVPLSRDDWSYRHVWAFLPFFYIGGVAMARRRYQ